MVITIVMFKTVLKAVLFFGAVAAKGMARMTLRRRATSAHCGVPVVGVGMTAILVMSNVALRVVPHLTVMRAVHLEAPIIILGKEGRLLLDTLSGVSLILSYLRRVTEYTVHWDNGGGVRRYVHSGFCREGRGAKLLLSSKSCVAHKAQHS